MKKEISKRDIFKSISKSMEMFRGQQFGGRFIHLRSSLISGSYTGSVITLVANARSFNGRITTTCISNLFIIFIICIGLP
jgi:hypothetical protein